MNKDLDLLDHARRPFTPFLYFPQMIDLAISLTQPVCEQIHRSDRVLYRQIDADAADGRHRMRGVADEK
jgi:hypothetical protein